MNLALDFDDEPESHDGGFVFWEGIPERCVRCKTARPLYELKAYGAASVCKDEVACKQRQAERMQNADNS